MNEVILFHCKSLSPFLGTEYVQVPVPVTHISPKGHNTVQYVNSSTDFNF